MGTFILKRKLYTVFDQTDTLKRMKDSDILAEKKKKENSAGRVAGYGLAAAGTVAGIQAGRAAIKGGAAGWASTAAKAGQPAAKFSARMTGVGNGIVNGVKGMNVKRLGKAAGWAGAAAAAYGLLSKDKEAEAYNRRLAYAQRQARRRESADWRSNMTQRDGYSY